MRSLLLVLSFRLCTGLSQMLYVLDVMMSAMCAISPRLLTYSFTFACYVLNKITHSKPKAGLSQVILWSLSNAESIRKCSWTETTVISVTSDGVAVVCESTEHCL